MTLKSAFAAVAAQEDLNFLLTNRIPRIAFSRAMGRISKVRHPLVSRPSIAMWRFFCDVDLSDAAEKAFPSLHAAFTRPLKAGARAIDHRRDIVISPCDAIVGAHGRIAGGQVHQIKGFPYTLADLLGDASDAAEFEGGSFVTLRLTAGMYHRFHAPYDLTVEAVRYISGDTWNVNPIALKRVERLYCKNERAPIRARLDAGGQRLVLVPVAAVLVSSIRLPFLDAEKTVRDDGERVTPCNAPFRKGDEMGWFEHGSTIVVLAPEGMTLAAGLEEGRHIRLGEPLMQLPD
ncbi:archaetidylserine decarboxylase [Sphingomonas sp. ID0503]|uniref:archaetidylserine decarboxylase n=1 Tax=Sphingomonas sp. ID0503 TaxID=3399691 RepID=UPI003AFA6709